MVFSGGFLGAELYRSLKKDVEITWDTESTVTLPKALKPIRYETSIDLIRILERTFNENSDSIKKLTMNHWLTFSLSLEDDMPKSVDYLDKTLGPLTYLVGESLSAADLAIFSVLHG